MIDFTKIRDPAAVNALIAISRKLADQDAFLNELRVKRMLEKPYGRDLQRIIAATVNKFFLQDTGADPTVAGQFQRSGAGLLFHDGTAARALIFDDDFAAALLRDGSRTITGTLYPETNITYSLGTSQRMFLNAYIKYLSAAIMSGTLTSLDIEPVADITSDLGTALKRYQDGYIDTLHYGALDPPITASTVLTDKMVLSGVKAAVAPFEYTSPLTQFVPLFEIYDANPAVIGANKTPLPRAAPAVIDLFNGEFVMYGGVSGYLPYPTLQVLSDTWDVTPDDVDCGSATRDGYGTHVWNKTGGDEGLLEARFEASYASVRGAWDVADYDAIGYFAGGYKQDATTSTTFYMFFLNPDLHSVTHSWILGDALPYALGSGVGGIIENDTNKYFCVGGGNWTDGIFYYYDTGDFTWKTVKDHTLNALVLPEPTKRQNATSFSITDAITGKSVMYVIGGWNLSTGFASTAYKLEWKSDGKTPPTWEWAWTEIAAFPAFGRAYPVSYVNEKDRYAVVGTGFRPDICNQCSDLYKYWIDTDTWEKMQPFPGGARSNARGISAHTYTQVEGNPVCTKVQSVLGWGDDLDGFIIDVLVTQYDFHTGTRKGDVWLAQDLMVQSILAPA